MVVTYGGSMLQRTDQRVCELGWNWCGPLSCCPVYKHGLLASNVKPSSVSVSCLCSMAWVDRTCMMRYAPQISIQIREAPKYSTGKSTTTQINHAPQPCDLVTELVALMLCYRSN